MYLITPLHPAARDLLTGKTLPAGGLERAVLSPADIFQRRTGDTSITRVEPVKNERTETTTETTKGKK